MRSGWAIAALVCAALPVEAPAEQAANWGVLSEIAERDFAWAGYALATRWVEPDRVLELHFLGPGFHQFHKMTANTDGTLFVQWYKDAKKPAKWQGNVRVASDGSIMIDQPKVFRWFGRDAEGHIFQMVGMTETRMAPLDPSSSTGQWFAKAVAAGKVRAAGNPALASTGQAPVRLVGTVPVVARPSAVTAPVSEPGAPLTEQQIAGLARYIGRTYVDVDSTTQTQTQVVSTRWIEQGKKYEFAVHPRFSRAVRITYQVHADGTLSSLPVSETIRRLDASGLPLSIAEKEGDDRQLRIVEGGNGYLLIQSQNTKKHGKPPKWKVIGQTERREITEAEGARLIAGYEAKRKARWAPLSPLTQGPWFCVQMEPGHWLNRTVNFHPYGRVTTRTYPVMRLTTARWITPWQDLEVVSTLGEGRKVTDRITMLSNGNFSMKTTGLKNFPPVIGKFSHDSGNFPSIDFIFNYYNRDGTQYNHGLLFYTTSSNSSDPGNPVSMYYAGGSSESSKCEMVRYDPEKSQAYSAQLTTLSRQTRESMQWDQEYWASIAQDRAEGQAMLNNLRGELFQQVLVGIPQAIADVNQQNAQLASLRVAAEQETAMKRAAEVAAADAARQQRSAGTMPSTATTAAVAPSPSTGPSPAQLAAERQAEQRRSEAARQQEARKQAEEKRLADLKLKEAEANRLLEFREGVVLCEQKSPKSWRCDGPLQVTYGDMNGPSGLSAISSACGGGTPRKLGMAAGYLAYGCGFGIHPSDSMRSYPGNRDVQAANGVGHIPGQAFYRCKRSVLAYCRGE